MNSHQETVSYDPLDPELWRDPYPTYERLRDEDPVHHVRKRGFWVLSRFADVMAATCDTEAFSSAHGLTFEEDEITKLGLMPTLVMMDRPRHTVFRRLVNTMFTPRAVAEREEAVRGFTRERTERVVAMGEADFVDEVASPLPSFVVADYLGVPAGDRSSFGQWSSAIVQANASGNVLSAGQAVGELYGYFTDLARWKKDHPAQDMISVLLQSEVDGRPVSLEEVLGFCFVMVAGGNDTASGLIGGAAALLSEHPDQRRLLASDPSRVPGAVEEMLRFLSPVQGLSRTSTIDVTVGPADSRVTIPAGVKVHLLFASANRDPREFGPDAGRLDVTRLVARSVAFSSGPHHCLGAAAARLEGRVVIEEMLRAMPDFVVDTSRGRYAPGPFTRRFEYLPIRATA
ncbi:MAG TPA: cytochrome P450 [Acidimicrobiales bacterium]|nr:cytochrome P450 [Acidimicrobiales bacterium]